MIAILNFATATAALNGDYDEWPDLRHTVMSQRYHERPFYAVLRSVALLGVQPTVWTCNSSLPGRVKQMRALYYLGEGPDIKVSEYWPRDLPKQQFPAVETYVLDD